MKEQEVAFWYVLPLCFSWGCPGPLEGCVPGEGGGPLLGAADFGPDSAPPKTNQDEHLHGSKALGEMCLSREVLVKALFSR